MIFSLKTILLISPEPWDHIFVSKHHYATQLGALGNHVYFLNPPSGQFKIHDTGYKNVWSVEYTRFAKGLRFYPSSIQRYFILQKFLEIQRLCGVSFDVVWSFDNSVFFDMSVLPESILKISHIVDLNQNFQSRRAAETADICFCTTDFIAKRLSKYSNRVHKINHGLNQVIENNRCNRELPGRNKIKALLVGNLAMQYLDWKILLDCVAAYPEVDFIFYGPCANDFSIKINEHQKYKKQLSVFPNTYFPGRIHSDEIPHVLKKADILMVSYQSAYIDQVSNPHKMMEYLSSGKVVVATTTYEYEELASGELIAMSKNNSEFPVIFSSVVENLEIWNSKEKSNQRKAFAFENTYEKHIKRIEKLISLSEANQ